LADGDEVVLIDNLSRKGTNSNLEWLRQRGRLEFHHVDLRDADRLRRMFMEHRDADRVLHLAAQVAVTTSLTNPREDFDVNALGTFNVLEGMRQASIPAPLIYASTNKVYGEMADVLVEEREGRYSYAELPCGIPESRSLDFHSPYGCSKGSADQYVIDYSRIYGLRTIVFRQSCIYGYRQFGCEDQGWVAWFMIASQLGRSLSIYGDGKQVRDILFIEDLLDAYDTAFESADRVSGRAFNIGGGPENVLSLLDLVAFIEHKQDRILPCRFDAWRPGDQKVYVSDIRRAQTELGWTPKVNCERGLELLYEWIGLNLGIFDEIATEVESPAGW
jgi:CDP-paratose 2-epimerase